MRTIVLALIIYLICCTDSHCLTSDGYYLSCAIMTAVGQCTDKRGDSFQEKYPTHYNLFQKLMEQRDLHKIPAEIGIKGSLYGSQELLNSYTCDVIIRMYEGMYDALGIKRY